jgi:lysine-specific demethylase/histidyl-hydroxylase NO66
MKQRNISKSNVSALSSSSSTEETTKAANLVAVSVSVSATAKRPRNDSENSQKELLEAPQEDDCLDFFMEEATKKVQFKEDKAVDGDGDGAQHQRQESKIEFHMEVDEKGREMMLPPPSVKRIEQLLPLSPSFSSSLSSSNHGLPTGATTEMTTEQRANCLLNFLLWPAGITADEFYATYWEKKPLLVQHRTGSSFDHRRRLSGLMSLSEIQAATRRRGNESSDSYNDDDDSLLYYGRDLNVTKYEREVGTSLYKRRTLDPIPTDFSSGSARADAADYRTRYVRVDPDELWDRWYGDMGCTVRLLCPHKHFRPVHSLLSLLEHEFGNMVGANAYLTPPCGAQGFAPHYDDIEAFVCQLEGRKRWRVYAPLKPSERLPRTSSRDYDPSELRRAGAQPVFDVVLEPGDVLYMPRGWIHQACTLPEASLDGDGAATSSSTRTTTTKTSEDGHSLHLTISTMQNWAWADLLEGAFDAALESLAESDSTTLLREGLPQNFLSYMGVAHDDAVVDNDALPDSLKRRPLEDGDEEDEQETKRLQHRERQREAFRREARRRIARVAQEALKGLDAACDQMAKRFLSDRLPPADLDRANGGSSSGGGSKNGDLVLKLSTLCRLARPGIARLVLEEGKVVVYHCADNSLVFHGKPLSPLEFEMDDGPALEQLVTTVEPRWIAVQDLFHDSPEDKLAVAQALYDEGILAVRCA